MFSKYDEKNSNAKPNMNCFDGTSFVTKVSSCIVVARLSLEIDGWRWWCRKCLPFRNTWCRSCYFKVVHLAYALLLCVRFSLSLVFKGDLFYSVKYHDSWHILMVPLLSLLYYFLSIYSLDFPIKTSILVAHDQTMSVESWWGQL